MRPFRKSVLFPSITAFVVVTCVAYSAYATGSATTFCPTSGSCVAGPGCATPNLACCCKAGAGGFVCQCISAELCLDPKGGPGTPWPAGVTIKCE